MQRVFPRCEVRKIFIGGWIFFVISITITVIIVFLISDASATILAHFEHVWATVSEALVAPRVAILKLPWTILCHVADTGVPS